MDAISAPGVERVVLMTRAQVGRTESVNNVVGFQIGQDAAAVLVLQPTAILDDYSPAPTPFGSFQPQKRMRGGGALNLSSDRL
jgi:hypothetical protein